MPPNRSHRRKIVDGITYRYCLGPLHTSGKWLPQDQFPWATGKNGYRYRRYECRACYTHRRTVNRYKKLHGHVLPNHGMILLSNIKPLIEEVVFLAGGVLPAARYVGVSHVAIGRWLGKPGYHNGIKRPATRINRRSAERIINALYALRRENRREQRRVGSQQRA